MLRFLSTNHCVLFEPSFFFPGVDVPWFGNMRSCIVSVLFPVPEQSPLFPLILTFAYYFLLGFPLHSLIRKGRPSLNPVFFLPSDTLRVRLALFDFAAVHLLIPTQHGPLFFTRVLRKPFLNFCGTLEPFFDVKSDRNPPPFGFGTPCFFSLPPLQGRD